MILKTIGKFPLLKVGTIGFFNSKFSFNLNVKLALVSKKVTPFFCCENEIKTLKTVRDRKINFFIE